MVYIIRKNLEQNLARLTLVFFISMGVKSCIYSSIRRYEGITKSMNEVAAFQSGGIADINNDGTLSEEEKRVRDNFYEECKNNFSLGLYFSFIQEKILSDSLPQFPVGKLHATRSEERRVGKEGRSRWSPYH